MFKAEELGGRNRNCWYSTSESKGREWDLVFLTSIFSLKYYSLDISAHAFLAEEFQGLEESREETISNQCSCAFGHWAQSSALGVFLETQPTSTLSYLVPRGGDPFGQRRGWPKGSGASGNEIGGCAAKSLTHAHKSNSARRITMINHSRVCSPGERWLESRET